MISLDFAFELIRWHEFVDKVTYTATEISSPQYFQLRSKGWFVS